MVEVIKDKRKWKIRLILNNEDCPYLYYPANYHGCRLVPDYRHDDKMGYCTFENCPFRIEEEEDK